MASLNTKWVVAPWYEGKWMWHCKFEWTNDDECPVKYFFTDLTDHIFFVISASISKKLGSLVPFIKIHILLSMRDAYSSCLRHYVKSLDRRLRLMSGSKRRKVYTSRLSAIYMRQMWKGQKNFHSLGLIKWRRKTSMPLYTLVNGSEYLCGRTAPF